MPINRIDPNTLTTEREAAAPETVSNVPTSEVIGAFFETENVIANAAEDISASLISSRFTPDPDFEPFDHLQGYEAHTADLQHAESREELTFLKSRIDEERKAREIQSAATGTQAVLGSVLSVLADPTAIIPATAGLKAIQSGNILKGGAAQAANFAAIETGREAYLQNSQSLRTTEEAIYNIGGSALVGGILGGASASLSRADLDAIGNRIQEELSNAPNKFDKIQDALSSITNKSGKDLEGLSVGAAEVVSLKGEGIKGIRRTQKAFSKLPDFLTNPALRGSISPSKHTRNITERLADVSLIKNKNVNFRESNTSVENAAKQYDVLKYNFTNDFNGLWKQYRNNVSKKIKEGGLSPREQIGTSKGGSLTLSEFRQEVGRATAYNDQHDIQEVQAAAQSARRNVHDPIKNGMIEVDLLDSKNLPPIEAPEDIHEIFEKVADETGIPIEDFTRVARIESNFDPIAKNPRSSAGGLFQFIDSTASQYGLVNRFDPEESSRAFARLWNDNYNTLKNRLGRDVSSAELYLAHQQGAKGAGDILSSPNKKAVDIVGEDAVLLNGGHIGMTAREFANIWIRKYENIKFNDDALQVKTAPSHATRLWDADKINSNYEEFFDINLNHLKDKRANAESSLIELKKKLKITDKSFRSIVEDNKVHKKLQKRLKKDDIKKLKSLHFKATEPDDYLEFTAADIINQITGLRGGRLGYDIKESSGESFGKSNLKRGSARERVYDIPDAAVEKFLIRDIHAIVDSQVRTLGPDIELMRSFGTLDVDEVKKSIADEYSVIINGAEKGKESAQIRELMNRDLADVTALWEKIRGQYASGSADDYSAPAAVAERAVLNWNFVRLLGGMTISAVPDIGRIVQVHGIERTLGREVGGLISAFKNIKFSVPDLREAAIGLDMALSTTAMARANMDTYVPVTGKIDRAGQAVAGSFGNVVLMNQWNTSLKTFSGVITQNRMINSMLKISDHKGAPQKEIENLASHGIGEGMAKIIAGQFKRFGETRGKVKIPNAALWDDVEAQRIFRAAVRKQVDEIIVTPGLDRPLWMSRPGWRLVAQFRSFSFAAMQRVTLAGLQQADAAFINGTFLMAFLGMGVYASKSALGGHKTSDDPRVWISEGIDRSGVTGWFMDVNNIAEKLTGGVVGINSLVGGPPMSRFASRNWLSAIVGPGFGLAEDFGKVGRAIATREWEDSDVRTIRKLLPYNNVFYARSLFDQLEEAGKDVLN